MPDENNRIITALKVTKTPFEGSSHDPEMTSNESMHDAQIPNAFGPEQEAFTQGSLDHLRPFFRHTDLMDRLDPNEIGNIEDKRDGPTLMDNVSHVWNTNLHEIGNLLKYGLNPVAATEQLPADAGDKLSGDAGFYDIGN